MTINDITLILASASPRRQQLLKDVGLAFTVMLPNIEEHMDAALSIHAQVEALAHQKALAVQGPSHAVVLAADTVVVLDEAILGKPSDDAQAVAMLQALSNRQCSVITAFCLWQPETKWLVLDHVQSTIQFKALSQQQILAYVATGEGRDKAGAFAIQGLGRELIAGFEGDFEAIVGLPVGAVLAHLQKRNKK